MNLKMQFRLLLGLLLTLGFGSYYGLADVPKLVSVDSYNVQNFRQKNQQLFKQLGITYLKNLEIVSPDVKKLDAKHTERYLRNPKHYDDLEKKYGIQISRGAIAPMSIRYINDQIGYGTFAEADIAKNDFVGEYTGRVMDLKDVKDTKYTWSYLSTHDKYGKHLDISLDAGPAGNELRFVNHDYKPNAVIQYVPQGGYWHACYIATRPIKKGEQILTNYGKRYWSGRRGEPHQFVKNDGVQEIKV